MVSGPAAESGSPAMALGKLTPSEPQFPHLEALRWPWGNQLPLSLSFLIWKPCDGPGETDPL